MMNQSCAVPSWDIIIDEENPAIAKTHSNPIHHHHLLPTVDYQIAELTWKDGHLGMHAFGVPNLLSKPLPLASSSPERCSWDKPLAAGTLESIVNQATNTTTPIPLSTSWFDAQPPLHIHQSLPINAMSCLVGSCTRVGSCSVAPTLMEEGKEVSHDWSSRVEQQSIRCSGSTILGSENLQHDTEDTGGFTTGNTTSSAKDGSKNTVDDHDSVWHGRNQGGDKEKEDKKRVTVLGKRSRCAAVHNQSERKRRDKINQRMSILQKLVPNSSKTDKASMLDEVIQHMKLLQNKVEMMSRFKMMLPSCLALQQQLLQMSFMTRPGMPTPPPPPPQGFMQPSSWDHHHMPQSTSMPTFSAPSFLANSQSQPSMTMDAYSTMAAMYHQLQVPPPPASDIQGII